MISSAVDDIKFGSKPSPSLCFSACLYLDKNIWAVLENLTLSLKEYKHVDIIKPQLFKELHIVNTGLEIPCIGKKNVYYKYQ